jgi:phosphatidate cytidylyltransferase
LLGTLIIGILVGLCWLDHLAETRGAAVRGVWLLPAALLLAVAASGEVLYLARAAGMRPSAWAVYGGTVLLIAGNWGGELFRAGTGNASSLPEVAWPWCALAVGVLLVFVVEMRRYEKPGGATANVAAAVFALVYVGAMFSFVLQLRMQWGVGALASLVIVTKMGDTGAYTIGRFFGRHKMAPVLSPGKTVEGAVGALALACLASWATFTWLLPLLDQREHPGGTCCGWVLFGLLVGTAGMLGDLAESMLKRDVGCKDSSRWMPGFGGLLDVLDSILLAAPAAWMGWALGLVG